MDILYEELVYFGSAYEVVPDRDLLYEIEYVVILEYIDLLDQSDKYSKQKYYIESRK